MSNFEVFKCSVCNRHIEKQVDQKRAPISKCTITYKCTGSLLKVSESDSKTMTGPASDVSLTNWVKRGHVAKNTSTEATASSITINSAQDVLSIAVNDSVTANELSARFEIKKLTNASYVEYFYNRPSNTVLISGQDDSSKRLSLRFVNGSTPDKIAVYLNGVEMNASGYDRSVPGRIAFNEALVDETNQIRVLVYKQDASSYLTLNFLRNDLSTVKNHASSSWGNVEKAAFGNVTCSVFTCTDVAKVPINSKLVLVDVSVKSTNAVLAGDFGYLVIADAPYSSYDRNLNNAINLSKLIGTAAIVEYKKDVKNSPKFYVSENSIQSLFPPIAILAKASDDIDSGKVNDSNTKLMNAYIT
jgi:hypothetical protein